MDEKKHGVVCVFAQEKRLICHYGVSYGRLTPMLCCWVIDESGLGGL
jgi:hypothetical protein